MVSCQVVPNICRVMYVFDRQRGGLGGARAYPKRKKKKIGKSCQLRLDDTRYVRTFCPTRVPEISSSTVPYCPRPLIIYSGGRTTNEGETRGKAGEGEDEKIMPKTVPLPCQRQRQASASVYVCPSIPPKDSRAPPPSPRRHHHPVSSVVGTPRYAQ